MLKRELVPGAPRIPGIDEVAEARPAVIPHGWGRWFVRALLAASLVAAIAAGLTTWWRTYVEPGPSPAVATLDLYARFVDLTPITVSVGGADNAPWHTTVDELGRNRALWQLMHVENWNTVPSPVRETVLDRILTHYRPVLMNPRIWDRMDPDDWDTIPQPVRTVAYRQMAAFWAGYYDVGGPYSLDAAQVRATLQAIVMSESWFEHRALRIDYTGNRDVGLVQASDWARERMRQLADGGRVDVSLTDEDYWNPWKATRFLAIWMSILLDETGGDLDRAVRAYNRGIARADDAAGDTYLAAVERRRRRFILNRDAPAAWTWLWHRAREIEAQEWPWLHGVSVPADCCTLSPAAPSADNPA